MAENKKEEKTTESQKAKTEDRIQRTKISQTRIPSLTLDEALRIPRAIAENYGYRPSKPLNVAKALNLTPTTGGFRVLCGASIGYGLTEGGCNSDTIEITKLGLRIVRCTIENDDKKARKEAVLRPSIINEFLSKYEDAALPREDIARNVLREMNIPEDRVNDVYEMIMKNVETEKLFKDIKGKKYVSFDDIDTDPDIDVDNKDDLENATEDNDSDNVAKSLNKDDTVPEKNVTINHNDKRDRKKVFLSHGKNRDFLDPIKKLLSFGELEAVVSVQQSSVSLPVPDKVINDMRICGAAIIHINTEEKLIDKDAQEHVIINSNVLIEIGAAMALYGRRFILLVEEGIVLP